jgi:hypothetical protein
MPRQLLRADLGITVVVESSCCLFGRYILHNTSIIHVIVSFYNRKIWGVRQSLAFGACESAGLGVAFAYQPYGEEQL